MLFNNIVFGPIDSRRLGTSLGINLLPTHFKICTMDCLYCECGWTKKDNSKPCAFPDVNHIMDTINHKLIRLRRKEVHLDSITFSGNGEPTLHPEFARIALELIKLRDHYFPYTAISCLSNSTQLHRPDVLKALKAIDNPIMKLDAGTQNMFENINRSFNGLQLDDICEMLKKFEGYLCIQTLFLRGCLDDGTTIDNTSGAEFNAWLKRIKEINPHTAMLYRLDRVPPAQHLEKIETSTLSRIGRIVSQFIPDTHIY